ncbi:MFS transporter [Bartonella sp. DGB2]|uniref:MFS transporter n=1 Tax=Bartonella sp. DGB2 TaxID=3388426 RepID=UPI00399034E1
MHYKLSEKYIGYTQNLYRARETAANAMNSIMLSIVGGYPPESFALSVSISFAFSLFSDIPLGIIADRLGHAKACIIGTLCVAISPLFLLLPIFFTVFQHVSIAIIILQTIIFSIGNTMLAVSYEAYIYEMVEALNRQRKKDNKKTKSPLIGISQLQKFGSYLSFVLPSLTIVAVMTLERYTTFSYICLFIPSLICIPLFKNLHFSNVINNIKTREERKMLPTIRRFKFALLPLIFLLSLYQITIIQANAYTLISMLTAENLRSISPVDFISTLMASLSLYIAYYIKGIIGSFLVEKFSFKRLVCILPVAGTLLALLSYIFLYMSNLYISFIIFCLFFRLFHSTSQELLISYILKNLHAEYRATTIAISRFLSIGSYAIFSFTLVYAGIAVPDLGFIFLSVAILSSIICILSFSLQWNDEL